MISVVLYFNIIMLKRKSYQNNVNECIKSLYKDFGNDIEITGVYNEVYVRELDEEELLKGEISAFVGKVGNYLVRRLTCVYIDGNGVDYRKRKPAQDTEITKLRKRIAECSILPILGLYDGGYREAGKISVKYLGNGESSAQEWHTVCFEDKAKVGIWHEFISFICTVKIGDREDLFVRKSWSGDSHSSSSWYGFTAEGMVEEFGEPSSY